MTDEEVTTVQLKKSVVKELKSIKRYKHETYEEVISDLIKIVKKSRRRSQYDEFLFRIQQEKMKELWDNKYDDEWEKAWENAV
ncbi:MAG: hypothetical protein M1160_00185 [Candidatus Marsarchaeota archaeon]|jgi:flagellar motor component MotA|nr:hypothetical protein [Candidatus Marsarchaeota archaeon]MCL5111289.1 hypothetical protein [Candidatus Marsarchaeota archaeon]